MFFLYFAASSIALTPVRNSHQDTLDTRNTFTTILISGILIPWCSWLLHLGSQLVSRRLDRNAVGDREYTRYCARQPVRLAESLSRSSGSITVPLVRPAESLSRSSGRLNHCPAHQGAERLSPMIHNSYFRIQKSELLEMQVANSSRS